MSNRSKTLIETRAIIVAYAMSRLDVEFLKRFSFRSWKEAFVETGKKLGVRPASMKNLRDEFDPIHPNPREGWRNRPLRKSRQQVVGDFCYRNDDFLLEVVARIIDRDKLIEELIVAPLANRELARKTQRERQRTGQQAEKHFLW
jgi:hypothetical protein